jgi:hypothetical protein
MDPYYLLASLLAMGGLAGLASLLRSGAEDIRLRDVISAALNSGLLAMIVGALLFDRYGLTAVWWIVGIAIACGLGGTHMIELVIDVVKNYLRSSINDRKNR